MVLRLLFTVLLYSWSYPPRAVVNATDTYIRHRRQERVLPRGVIPLNRRRIDEEKKKASNDNFPLILIQIDGSDTGIVGAADGFEAPPTEMPDTTTESRAVDGLGATNESSKSSTPWPSINDAISTPWPSINDGISSPWPSINDVSPASRKPSSTPTSSPMTEKPSSDAPTPNPSDSPASESPTSNEPTLTTTTMRPTLKPTLNPATKSPTYMPTYMPTSQSPTSKPTSRKPSSTPTSSPTTEEPSSDAPTPNPSDSPTSESPTSNEPTLTTTMMRPTLKPTTTPTTAVPSEDPTLNFVTEFPTYMPTYMPTSQSPTSKPTSKKPSLTPTSSPTTEEPSSEPTPNPSHSPTSESPTSNEPTLITTTTLISRSITTGPTLKPTDKVIPTYYPTYSSSTRMPSEGPTLNPVTGFLITDLPTSTAIEQFSQSMSMVEMSIHTVESSISLSMKMIDLSVPKELTELSMSMAPIETLVSLDLHNIYTESMSLKDLELSMPFVDVSLSMKMISLPQSVPMKLNEMSILMAVVEMPLMLELHDIYTEITDSFIMSMSLLELSMPVVEKEISISMGAIEITLELNNDDMDSVEDARSSLATEDKSMLIIATEVSMSMAPVATSLSLELHDFYSEVNNFSMPIGTLELSTPAVDVFFNLSVPKELNELSISVAMPLSLELNDFYTEITDFFSMPMETLELSMPVVDVSLSMKMISLSAPIELNEMSMSMAVVEMPLSLEMHDIYTEITDSFSMSMSVLELSMPFVDDESLSMDAIEIPLELDDMNILDFHGEIINEPTSSEPTSNPTYRPTTSWPTYEPTSSPIKAIASPSNGPSLRFSGNPSFDSSVGPSIPLNELSFTITETPTMLTLKSFTENPSTNSPSATSLVPTFGGTYSTISAKVATYSPTRMPSTAPIVTVEANAQLELKGVDSEMDDEAALVFKQTCSSFVEDSLIDTKTSALTIECKIINQQMSSGGRRLSGEGRGLIGVVRGMRAEPSLLVDVTIEGSATSTYAAADASKIDFSTEVIDAFASQSSQFTKQLKENGNKTGIKYFDDLTSTSVGSIDGDSAANEIVTSTGDLNSRESAKTTSSNGTYIVIIATACLTSIVLAVIAYITITTRKKTSHGELVEEDNETAGNILNDLGACEVGYMLSPKYIKHEPSSLSVLDIITCEGPVHQTIEIVTPQGKLGIVVTTQPEGPVVYSIKNESPLQGLIFVDDLIVAIDGEDTRGWTAQSFVKIVAKKKGASCKLTVLRTIDNNKECPISL